MIRNKKWRARNAEDHTGQRFIQFFEFILCVLMGVPLNGGTPKTPQNDHF